MEAFSDSIECGLLVDDLRNQCASILLDYIRYSEDLQNEGRWGLPNTTALMLRVYIKSCDVVDKYEKLPGTPTRPNAEIIFKSIRWLSDNKIRFSDGSVLHAFNHTAYFVLSLQYMVLTKCWLLDYELFQLYDHIVWENQIRSTRERAEILQSTDKLITLNNILMDYQKILNTLFTATRVGIIVAAFLIAFFLANQLNLINYSNSGIALIQPGPFLSVLGITISISTAFWAFSNKWMLTLENVKMNDQSNS